MAHGLYGCRLHHRLPPLRQRHACSILIWSTKLTLPYHRVNCILYFVSSHLNYVISLSSLCHLFARIASLPRERSIPREVMCFSCASRCSRIENHRAAIGSTRSHTVIHLKSTLERIEYRFTLHTSHFTSQGPEIKFLAVRYRLQYNSNITLITPFG